MARETLRDFLSSTGKGASDKISYANKSDGDNDLGIDPNTGEELLDLDDELSGILGDYLNYLTENVFNNRYPISAGNERAATSNRGDNLVIAEEQGAEKVFVEQGTDSANALGQYSSSGKFDLAGYPVRDIVDKKGRDEKLDGNNLYTNIDGTGLDTSGGSGKNLRQVENSVVEATQKLLLANNRFSNISSGFARTT